MPEAYGNVYCVWQWIAEVSGSADPIMPANHHRHQIMISQKRIIQDSGKTFHTNLVFIVWLESQP